ncbi:MAG: terminase small subunit [Ruminococcus sp.]|nr:terminase small subunit [Ruminococcus sp.]
MNNQLYDFCCYYVMLGDVTESAVKAGFDRKNALQNGIKLLESEKCRNIISRIRNAVAGNNDVPTGLKRLAFGNCTDAVYLVFADELPPPDVISRLDIFNVSEIKRIKGGGVEIKFFDRLKALEKLFELENTFSDTNKATDLIKALADSSTDGEELEN